jgi:hypothetical protein
MSAYQGLLILHSFLVLFIISLLKLYLRNGKITASARDEIVFLNISEISSVICYVTEFHSFLRQQSFRL